MTNDEIQRKLIELESRIELLGPKKEATADCCRWINDKTMPGGRWFLPRCMGGAMNELDGCTCIRVVK